MRIAVFAEYFPPRMGSDRRIYELMKRMTKKHTINFLVVPPFRGLQGTIEKDNLNISKSHIYVHERLIANYLEIPKGIRQLWRKSLTTAYLATMLLLIPKTIKKIVKTNSKIIIINYPSVYTGVLGFVSAKILRKKCIVDFNDLIAQYTIQLLKIDKKSVLGKTIVLVQDFIVKHADSIVAPTNFIKNYALSLGVREKKILVIPNGVDTKIFNAKVKSDYKLKFNLHKKKVCLYFGRLDDWAGVNILAEICNILEQKMPDVKFLMVGDGDEKIKFSKNVVTIKPMPHEELPKIINIADVALVPFPKNEVSHAASPLKLFEAMAMRKPVVASGVSGICEVVKNGYNGLLIDSNAPEEWIAVLETVLNSEKLRNEIGRNAEESARNYDWNTLTVQFEEALLNQTSMKEIK